jgi:hypothetical protein
MSNAKASILTDHQKEIILTPEGVHHTRQKMSPGHLLFKSIYQLIQWIGSRT